MKKAFIILLMLMYGASSFGMSLHFHYCCGKLDKVDFSSLKNKQCDSGKYHNMGGKPCCDNKQVSLNIKSDQDPGKVLHFPFHHIAVKPTQSDFLISSPVATKKLLPEIFAPPPLQKNFTQLYCIYRI